MESFLGLVKKFEKDLLKAWEKKKLEPSAFPGLASQFLIKYKLHEKFPGKVDWLKFITINEKHPDIHHYDLNFTQNVHFTLIRNPHFFIDLYSWIDHTEAHSHNFTGAFQVMSGNFYQINYSFEEGKRVNHQIELGRLKILDKKELEVGTVQPIQYREKFIHQVLHAELPAISLCVRTPDTSDDYVSFFYPGLCLGEMLFKKSEHLRIKAFSQICQLEKKVDVALATKLFASVNSSVLLYDYMNDFKSFHVSNSAKAKLAKIIENKYKGKVDLKKIKKAHEVFLSKIQLGF